MGNTPGQNANAVAELVFGMMLTSARNNYDGTSGFELTGRSIAFYGFGAVARAVGKIATGAFGMKMYAYDPFIKKEQIAAMGATPVDNACAPHGPDQGLDQQSPPLQDAQGRHPHQHGPPGGRARGRAAGSVQGA